MISLDNTLISDDIKDVLFCCDLSKCKGACCIEGDAGAPLTAKEISDLEDHIDEIKPYMTPGGVEEIERNGVFDYDAAGNLVTPLVTGKECAFIRFEEDIARCAIEKAFSEKKIPFAKPLSCNLYPVRITKTRLGEAVNYHKWHICSKARENGRKLKLPLYVFLEDALIRKYGRPWYNKLVRLLYQG
jgi:hypothetical protein